MRDLLSINQKRQLHLLEYLSNTKLIPQKVLLKELAYNKKTLLSDIIAINAVISPLFIQNQPYQGISLSIPANYNFDYIYSRYLSENIEFAILESIFFDETYSLSTLAEYFYISSSTLRRILSNINKNLSTFSIEISLQPLALIGDEEQIYLFMTNLLYEKYAPPNLPFNSLQIECLEQLILTVSSKTWVSLTFSDFNRIKIWLLIIIIRIKNGHYPKVYKQLSEQIESSVLTNSVLTSSFYSNFQIPLTKQNLAYMFQFLMIQDYATDLSSLSLLSTTHASVKYKLDIIEQTLEKIANEYNLAIKNKQQVILKIYNKSLVVQAETFILNNRNKHFVDAITAHNSTFLTILTEEFDKLYPQRSMKEYEMYALAYCLTTNWPQLSLKLQSSQKKLQAGLFFYTDVAHAHFIKEELSAHFNTKLQFTIMTELSLSDFKKNASNFDIVITNIYGLEIENVHVVCFPNVPSIKEYKILDELIGAIE